MTVDTAPPHDLQAESAALGATLLSTDATSNVVEILRPADFYRPAHGLIFEVVRDLYSGGEPCDTITVAAELGRRGLVDKVGGPAYLHTLVAAVPTTASAGYYARIVAGLAVRRRVAEAGVRITQIGFKATGDDPAGQAEAALAQALDADDTGDGPTPIGDTLTDTLDRLEARETGQGLTGVPTGFSDLDKLTSGLQPGQLVVIAARPAVGKSTLALDMARAAAIRHSLPVLFASLEMSRPELDDRLISAEARVPLQNIRTGQIGDDWPRISRRLGEIANAPLHIDASPDLSVATIRTRARRMQRRGGLSLLVVDYLQLLVTAGKSENRQQEVSAISRSLKLLAGELGIPVIALSQLNRGAEYTKEHKPQLSQLRDSGAIEQDADMVILIWRPDAVEAESARAGEADLIVAKNRNGPMGTVTVAFQGHFSRFVDMAS
ncbi:primary replicative DNA helicase [Frankia sp. EI5c]|uniref:replicative DNA helicase n=1 Tax=Frankia sp. EI5c TaxID=683316 RepID=UPI0007C2F5F7|nr:replicative DNA helicase [Frankia sp. EI5c]OAA23599.1 primary replicative DNA helicase [Frankia sp. EI5c]